MSKVSTILLEHRKRYDDQGLDRYEHLNKNYGFVSYARNSQLIPGFQADIQNRRTENIAYKVPVVNAYDISVDAERSLTIAENAITTGLQTLTGTTIRVGFQMRPITNYENEIQYFDELDRKLTAAQQAMLLKEDEYIEDLLNTNKTQFSSADGNPYTLTSNELLIANAQKNNFILEIDHYLKDDNFDTSSIHIIGNSRIMSLFNELKEHAVYNSQNKAMRIMNKNLYISSNVDTDATYGYVGYALPSNAMSIAYWLDFDAIQRTNAERGEGGMVERIMLPLLGHEVAVYSNTKYADLSGSVPGGQRSLVEEYELSYDLFTAFAYNSTPTTRANPNYKFKIEKEA